MKKLFTLCLSLIAFFSLNAQFTTVEVKDSISQDTWWTADKQYLLKGYVYVINGTTLHIQPGTIIRGDKNTKGSLIVERGAKLIANGTAQHPIVFTSNQPAGSRTYGDWGGVILCGKAPVNWSAGYSQVEGGPRSLYGGTDTHDNSGEMHYVRIEFPGVAFSPNNEINGLTLCGVGDATQLDHIQVSYSGDDSYEWFGGSVNAKYIVAFRGWDDDFDTDNGYNGKNQFVVGIRDPYAADQSGSKAFESDSYQAGTATGLTDTLSLTRPVFCNSTVIGPMVSPTSTAWDPQFVAGAHIRRGSAMSLLNSIVAGYPCGILIDESSASFGSTVANIQNGNLQIRNTIICGTPTNTTPNPKDLVYVINGARSLTPTTADADTTTNSPFGTFAGPFSWFNGGFGNKTYPTEQNGVRLQNPYNLSNPNCVPTSTSPICYNASHVFDPTKPINTDTSGNYANYNVPAFAPNFSVGKASDAFFTKVNFVGAFSGTQTTSDNWMNGWCNFDPVNTNYEIVSGIDNSADNIHVMSVYPNPAQNNTNLSFVLNKGGKVKITVISLNGELVANQTLDLSAGQNIVELNTENLINGIYAISIQSEGGIATTKMVVSK